MNLIINAVWKKSLEQEPGTLRINNKQRLLKTGFESVIVSSVLKM